MSDSEPARRATVRLPAVLADYACARTLVCCKPPWRVHLGPHEDEVLLGRVSRVGDRQLTARVRAAIERPAPGVTLLTQPEEGCTLLDLDDPGCTVHRVAGIAALGSTCRNFPRSVVRTPDGLEVAFLLQCPTAAGIVARTPQPFTWVERDLADWPYDARRGIARQLWWDDRKQLGYDELTALRTRWWSRLAGAGDAPPTAEPILALLDAPGAPDAPARDGTLAVFPPDEVQVSAEQRFLDRQHARGTQYAARAADVAAALALPPSRDALARAWAAAPQAYLCNASLSLQHAGVHTTQPVHDVFRGAAWQTLEAISLVARLIPLSIGDDLDAVHDGLCVAGHVSRWLAQAHNYTSLN